MKKYATLLSILILASLPSSCGGGGDVPSEMPPDDDEPVSVPDPSAATLIFPEDNTECNEGEIIDDATSTVIFRWNESQNTDDYQINVVNLNTDIVERRVSVIENEAPLVINRGTPYEWFVVSRADGTNTTATSSRFRFYNEGPGIENYAPFPAKAINPSRGSTLEASTTLISLEWEASDVDGDIVEFEGFFGTDSNPPSIGRIQNTSFTNLSVASGNTYYWQIITYDSENNSSTSEVFQFRVE
ncbi:hypothetical protein [Allomuricauda sp. d1]|uniref:hypothetical protein n=1 Tax=Allomuricauda sp. d1 TaxID=3136725 RepID=UPI0031D15B28